MRLSLHPCRFRRDRFRHDESGAAAVEFALLITVFLLTLLGVFDVARYVADQQDLMSAVYAAGRYAITNGSTITAQSLQNMVGGNLKLVDKSLIKATATVPANTAGTMVTVSASYTWTPLVPMLPLQIPINAKSVVTILH